MQNTSQNSLKKWPLKEGCSVYRCVLNNGACMSLHLRYHKQRKTAINFRETVKSSINVPQNFSSSLKLPRHVTFTCPSHVLLFTRKYSKSNITEPSFANESQFFNLMYERTMHSGVFVSNLAVSWAWDDSCNLAVSLAWDDSYIGINDITAGSRVSCNLCSNTPNQLRVIPL